MTGSVDYCLILRLPDEGGQPDDGDFLFFELNQLPALRANPYHFWQSCRHVNEALQAQHGLRVITLRPLCTLHQTTDDGPLINNLYLMRYLDGTLPPGARWLKLTSLTSLPENTPFTLEKIRQTLAVDPVPAWYNFAWYDELKRATQPLSAAKLQQLRSWERSSVWRIELPAGTQYLKVVPPQFAHELPLTRWLHHLFPDNIPKSHPIQMDHTLLLEDCGPLTLHNYPVLDRWQEALPVYAAIQIASVEHLAALARMGVPHRGLSWIGQRIDPFFNDDVHFERGSRPLSMDERAALRRATPFIHSLIQRLRAGPIPETLEHGDYWAGQIFVRDGHPIISDWSDATISYPLFSLPFLLEDLESDFPDQPDANHRLRDAYLEKWRHFGTVAQLQPLLAGATILYGLHNALRYHHDILPAMGQQWEMENMVNHGLRLFLQAVA